MRKVWKWIIGIVLGLIVLAVLVGVGFALRGGFHAVRAGFGPGRGWYQAGPGMMPFGGYGGHMRGPGMMGGFGLSPFGGILGGLISLGLIALVVLGIIWLVRSLRSPSPVVQATASAPAQAPVEMTACKNCGKPLQEDWKNCPYCGKKV